MKNFYKVIEILKIFKVKQITIRRWCMTGLIKSKKLGKSWYIPKNELEIFEDFNKITPLLEK